MFLWSAAQTVTVTGVDDNDPDGPQDYTITLNPSSTGDSDYDGLDDVLVSGTNEDDDAVTVTLSVSAARLAEGESAAVTARLGRSVGAATTIRVSVAAGTGASSAHFRLSENRTLTGGGGVADQHGDGDHHRGGRRGGRPGDPASDGVGVGERRPEGAGSGLLDADDYGQRRGAAGRAGGGAGDDR